MDIWEILGIAYTLDINSIREAYHARVREIQPEENPEAFRRLQKAYQAAYQYAAFMMSQPPTSDTDAADKEPVRELISEEDQHNVDAFVEYWKAFKNSYHNSGVSFCWKSYLASEAFQSIRYHPLVLYLLTEELGKSFFDGSDEMKMQFWEAYGFREDDTDAYQEEVQRLWNCLNPAYIKQQRAIRSAQKEPRREKILRALRVPALIVILFFCVIGGYLSGSGIVLTPVGAAVLLYYVMRQTGNPRE